VWGEEVECNTRLEVARFVEDNNLVDALVAITVDGILTDREIKIG
jgi:sulfur carrier protein ThiS